MPSILKGLKISLPFALSSFHPGLHKEELPLLVVAVTAANGLRAVG